MHIKFWAGGLNSNPRPSYCANFTSQYWDCDINSRGCHVVLLCTTLFQAPCSEEFSAWPTKGSFPKPF